MANEMWGIGEVMDRKAVCLASRTSGFSIWKNVRAIHGTGHTGSEQWAGWGEEGGWSDVEFHWRPVALEAPCP